METFIVLGLCFILYEALDFLQACIHSAAPSTVNQLRESYAKQLTANDEDILIDDNIQNCTISKAITDSKSLLANKLLESKSSLSLSALTVIDNKHQQLQQQLQQQQQSQPQQNSYTKQNSTFSLHKFTKACTLSSPDSVIDTLEISSNPELNSIDTYFSIPITNLSSGKTPILSTISISQQQQQYQKQQTKELQQEEHQHRLLHEQKQKIRKNLSSSLRNFRNSSIEKRSIISSTDSLSSNTPILVHKEYHHNNSNTNRNLNFLSKLSSSGTNDYNRVYPSTLSLDRVGVGLIQLPQRTNIKSQTTELSTITNTSTITTATITTTTTAAAAATTTTTTTTDGITTILIDPIIINKNISNIENPKIELTHAIINDEKNFKEFQFAERNRINNYKNNLLNNSKNLTSNCYNISNNYSNNNNNNNNNINNINNIDINRISFKDNDLVNGLMSTAIENNEILMPKRSSVKNVFSISESLDFQI